MRPHSCQAKAYGCVYLLARMSESGRVCVPMYVTVSGCLRSLANTTQSLHARINPCGMYNQIQTERENNSTFSQQNYDFPLSHISASRRKNKRDHR